jgi:PE family
MGGGAMSFVTAVPEALATAASDLANLGSTISQANASAAAATTGVLPPAADEVSEAIAALFGSQAQQFQALSSQAAAFHNQFVQALNGSGASYAGAEATAASAMQNVSPAQALDAMNAPAQGLLGRPLIGNGANGGTINGVGQPGEPGGILYGNGGNGGDSFLSGVNGGAGGSAGLMGNGGAGGASFGGGTGGAGGRGGLLMGNGGAGGAGTVGGNGGNAVWIGAGGDGGFGANIGGNGGNGGSLDGDGGAGGNSFLAGGNGGNAQLVGNGGNGGSPGGFGGSGGSLLGFSGTNG